MYINVLDGTLEQLPKVMKKRKMNCWWLMRRRK